MLGPQQYGGIGRYLHNLLEHLLAQQEAEYTLLGRENANGVSRNGHRTVPLDVPIYSLREQLLLPMKLKGQCVDLLHSPHYNIPIGVRCPLVVTVHDITHLRLPPSRKTYWYARIMLDAACRKARCIITPSHATAEDLRSVFHIPQEKLHVVPHGVEARFHPEVDADVLAAYRLSSGLPSSFILYVGGTRAYKNLPQLVRAFAILRKRGVAPGCKLVIASHELPPKDPRLPAAIREENLTEEVLLHGPIPDRELPLVYNAATVLAFPSRCEGFGFPPLEAMACGTPVVCSDAGSLREVAGDAALLVSGDDPETLAGALERVLTDSELRREMRTRGLQQASRFSWETAARRTFEIYHQALMEGGTS